MPRVPDDTADIAFYLYPSEAAARSGEQAGGTGFIVMKPFDRVPSQVALLLVTNKHVLQKGHRFVRLNRADKGPPDIFPVEDNQFFVHRGPHDVAVILGIGGGGRHQLRKNVAYEQLFSSAEEARKDYDIGIGDDVVMVGRFIGHDGKEINRPSVRFGNICVDVASIYNTEAGYNEESYAVEMRSKPGFSGSAVLVYALHGSTTRLSEKKAFIMCLGVNWGHIVEPRPLLDETGKEAVPKQFIKSPTDMAGVVPSWRVRELIDSKEVKVAMNSIEDTILAQSAGM